MDTNSIFMLGFYVWSLIGIALLVWQLWSRKGWALPMNKFMLGLSIGVGIPMLILATAMGMSMDGISAALSPETHVIFFAWICPGVAVLALGLMFFVMWLVLRKYALLVFNASADNVADCVVQALQSHHLEYVEEYPKFVVNSANVVISLVDNPSLQTMVEVSNKAQFHAWAALEQDIVHRVKHNRATSRPWLVYVLLMYMSQLLTMPFLFIFPTFKINLFGESGTYIKSAIEFLLQKGLSGIPLLILFSVFFLVLGLRLVFGKPVVFRFNAILPFFVLIIILAFIIMTVEYGLGWPTVGLFLSDIVLWLWIADLPSIVIASNTSQPVILEAFQTAFQRNNVHFSKRRSRLYLPRLNRIITVHPNKGNPDLINLVIEGRGNKLEFNNLLNDALSEMKKQRIRQFTPRGIIYIVIGLLPALYFLFK